VLVITSTASLFCGGEVQHAMAQRMVRFSDLTNKIIEDNDATVRIVVERHPALRDGPWSSRPLRTRLRPSERVR
jgi:hypothetical protein